MSNFLQLLFNGLGIGAIYALVSLGFVLLIRAASVVNFGQGEFSMLGAYLLVVFFNIFGINYYVSMALSIVIMAGFGVIFAYTTYWPLRFRGGLPVIIDGQTVGAVAVSGLTEAEDEELAELAIAAIRAANS